MRDLGFWLAVMLAAVVGVVLFKFAGALAGERFPALAALAAWI